MIRTRWTLLLSFIFVFSVPFCVFAAAEDGADLPRWVYEPPAGIVSEVGSGESWLEAFADGLVHLGQAIQSETDLRKVSSDVGGSSASKDMVASETFKTVGQQAFGDIEVKWMNKSYRAVTGDKENETVDESSSETKLVRFQHGACSYELKYAMLNETCGEGEGAGDLNLSLVRSGCTLGDLLQALAREGVTVAEEERTADGRFFLLLTDSNSKRYETEKKK